MPEVLDVNAQAAILVAAANSPKVWTLDRYYATVKVQVTAVSATPVGTFTVSYDGGTTYSDVIVFNSAGSTPYAQAASITLTSGMTLEIPTAGATHLKYTRVSGTSATMLMVGVQQSGIVGSEGANARIAKSGGTPAVTNPSFTNATSFTLVAANAARTYLLIQNNSAVNIAVSLEGGTLTGIVPTATNECIVLVPGDFYESPANYCPQCAITGYQTSGATTNLVTVVEG